MPVRKMSHFYIEPTEAVGVTPKGFIKIFAKDNEHLPLEIDVEKRYGIFCTEGEQYLEQIRNFEVRKDDVWVLTMPKSGTTWMMEMVWLLLNDLDYKAALKTEQRTRCRYLEYVAIYPSSNSIEEANKMKSPRVLKSHLPIHLLPKGLWTVKPKIIYVARDPKDAIVSYCHFVNKLGTNLSPVDVFVNETISGRSFCGPHWSHIAEFWSLRNQANIFFTSFERMKKDLRREIVKVSKFLETMVLSEQQLDELYDHLTFDKMKHNSSCNNVNEIGYVQKLNGLEVNPMGVFIRNGQCGSYKKELSADLVKKLDDWTDVSLKPFGVTAEEILLSEK